MFNILASMSKFGTEKKPFDILKDLAEKHKVLRKQVRFSQSELAKPGQPTKTFVNGPIGKVL